MESSMSSNGQQMDDASSYSSSSTDNRTNLIINYLPQSMNDERFRVLFAQFGDIRSARIIRNKNTGYSYGFGFVDYFSHEDAANAIDNLNGIVYESKTMKVAYARPSRDDIKNANLYVTNLPDHYTVDMLRSLFSPFGDIIQCRLLDNKVAFVLYNLHEEACRAIDSLNNQSLPGTHQVLSVKFANKEIKQNQQHTNNGQSLGENRMELRPIQSSSHHNRLNPMLTFGPSPVPALSNLNSLNWNNYPYPQPFHHQHQQHHRQHHQQHHQQHQHHPPAVQLDSRNSLDKEKRILFVYNIGLDADEIALNKLFSFYGPVEYVNIIRNSQTGRSKGYAFVAMDSHHDACNAILALHGYTLDDKPLQVSFKHDR